MRLRSYFLDFIARSFRDIALFIGGLVSIAFAIAAASSLIGSSNAILYIFSAALIAFVMQFTCALIHELGHAIAAWSCGWRVHVIAVYGIGIALSTGELYRFDNNNRDEVGGFVFCTPRAPRPNRLSIIWVSLAGPFANFLFVLPLLAYDNYLDRTGYIEHGFLLIGTILTSIVMGITNLLPLKWGKDIASDGLNIIRALRQEEWLLGTWAPNRLDSIFYDKRALPVEDWELVKAWAIHEPSAAEPQLAILLEQAWFQSDWEGFQSLVEHSQCGLNGLNKTAQHQHIFCHNLLFAFTPENHPSAKSVLSIFSGSIPEYDRYYWLARSVALFNLGRVREAQKAANATRAAYSLHWQAVPPELENILKRVDAGNAPLLQGA